MTDCTMTVVTGGPLDVNTYVVSNGDSCVLIDPGAGIEQIENAVGDKKVEAVLLTHGHFDHILSVSHWTQQGALLCIHEKDASMLAQPELNLSRIVGQSISIRNVGRLLTDGETFEAAGMSFRVIHTPGHTEGSVCYQIGEVLFSGDTMFRGGCGRTDLPGGDMTKMEISLEKLRRMKPTIRVFPGHGPSTTIGMER